MARILYITLILILVGLGLTGILSYGEFKLPALVVGILTLFFAIIGFHLGNLELINNIEFAKGDER